LRQALLGGAAIYQDGRKFEATATLFADHASFFGHYQDAAPDGVSSGPARIRFSDGSEAEVALAAVDPDRGGFRLTSELRELRQVAIFPGATVREMSREAGNCRLAAAVDAETNDHASGG
jgi:hypothetical protein